MKNFIKIVDIQPNQKICIINMPVPFREELAKLPEGVLVSSHPVGRFHKVILFVNTKEELATAWKRLMTFLVEGGEFWINWPNKGYRVYNEIDDEFVKGTIKEEKTLVKEVMMVLPGWNGTKIIK
jgi:hypothetical protein